MNKLLLLMTISVSLALVACSRSRNEDPPDVQIRMTIIDTKETFVVSHVEFDYATGMFFHELVATKAHVKTSRGWERFLFIGYHPEIIPGTILEGKKSIFERVRNGVVLSAKEYPEVCVSDSEQQHPPCASRK